MGTSIAEFPFLFLEIIVSTLLGLLNAFFQPAIDLIDFSKETMEKLKKLFSFNCRKVTEGEKSCHLYSIPVFQRSDGLTVKLGAHVIRREDASANLYNVKKIVVRADLEKVLVILVPSECGAVIVKEKAINNRVVEEVTVSIEDIVIVQEKGICADIARNGMDSVSKSVKAAPYHIQKLIRKHQLSSTMRKQIQSFLSGFSMAGSCSLGCVNWQLDPYILGLERETDFSMEYRVERSVDNVSHMDLLMGSQWDVRNLSCTDGYRIILTLELLVDSGQEIILKMHATLISGKLEPDSYRAVCLRDTSNLHMICNRRLSDITNNRTRRLSDITNNASGAVITPGQTLAWDEFQTQQSVSAGNSPWRQCGGVAGGGVGVSLEEMFASGGGSLPTFPTSSTSGVQTLEKLLSALPQSQIVFNSPIKEVSGEYTGTGVSSVAGPNTSTPADDLDSGDQQVTSITPHSSPSLQEHKAEDRSEDRDEELEGLCLKENKLVDKVTFAIPEEQDVVDGEDEEKRANNLETSSRELKEEFECVVDGEEDIVEDHLHLKVKEVNDGDSVKPSPNISTDFEDSSPSKTPLETSESGDKFLENNALLDINTFATPHLPHKQQPLASPPVSHSSLKRVRDYIQSLPSPKHFIRRDGGGDVEGELPSPQRQEDDTASVSSLVSGSQSMVSRQSELSSLAGARMGRGMFYGVGAAAAGPVCPFPEEWQQTIPECIENDDDID